LVVKENLFCKLISAAKKPFKGLKAFLFYTKHVTYTCLILIAKFFTSEYLSV